LFFLRRAQYLSSCSNYAEKKKGGEETGAPSYIMSRLFRAF